jgi:hypothetical protein
MDWVIFCVVGRASVHAHDAGLSATPPLFSLSEQGYVPIWSVFPEGARVARFSLAGEMEGKSLFWNMRDEMRAGERPGWKWKWKWKGGEGRGRYGYGICQPAPALEVGASDSTESR